MGSFSSGRSIIESSDGNYVSTGYYFGNPYDDTVLRKTSPDGTVLWSRILGDVNDDRGFSLSQTSDNGYIVTGWSRLDGINTGRDLLLIKTDSEGNEIWTRKFDRGDSLRDEGWSVKQTSDGGYIVLGDTHYTQDEVRKDLWLIRTDSEGNELWNRTYGGDGLNYGKTVIVTGDGGYQLFGYTTMGYNGVDMWLLKVDQNGDLIWSQMYGGTGDEYGTSMIVNDLNEIVMLGSHFFQVGGNYTHEIILKKTDDLGQEIWNRVINIENGIRGVSLSPTFDGGHFITGYVNSGTPFRRNLCIVKTDLNGYVIQSE